MVQKCKALLQGRGFKPSNFDDYGNSVTGATDNRQQIN